MNTEDRIEFYRDNYDTIYCGIYRDGHKQYIGTKGKCRFCGCSTPEVTFSNVAHAIPEFLGNHSLILNEECDTCNEFFSKKIEDHLDKYTKPFRTLAMITGKNGVPTYRSRDHAHIRPKNKRELHIENPDELRIITRDEDAKTLTIKLDFEPHIPAAVYKTLVKIAISCIEDEPLLEAFEQPINWILNPDHNVYLIKPLKMLVTLMPGRGADAVVVHLLRKKEGKNGLSFVFILAFGNFIYQIFIPTHLDVVDGKMPACYMPRYPSELGESNEYGDFKSWQADLSESAKRPETSTITLKYDTRMPIDISTVDEKLKTFRTRDTKR